MNSPHLQAYGWAQLDDGDWEFRDPSIPELVYLQSLQRWTSTTGKPRPHHYGGIRIAGKPDFRIGADGQVTAERGLHFLRPTTPFVISEGGLTMRGLYTYGRAARAFEPEFHAANPHLAYLHPDSPIPAGVRVHIPHYWAPHLHMAGYTVHRPHVATGLGDDQSGSSTDVVNGGSGAPMCSDGSVAPGGDTSQCPEVLAAQAAVAQATALTAAAMATVAAAKPKPAAAKPSGGGAAKPITAAQVATTAAAATAAAAAAATAKAAADKAAADKAATSSTPWIIGGVVGGAALLGVLVAVAKKRTRATVNPLPGDSRRLASLQKKVDKQEVQATNVDKRIAAARKRGEVANRLVATLDDKKADLLNQISANRALVATIKRR